MLQRAAFVLVAAFWVLMNVLLWRAEYGRQNAAGSEVPVGKVWQKVLSAADISALEIRHHGRRIGFCRWGASVLSAQKVSDSTGDESGPEGMVQNITGYRLDFGGNVVFGELPSRWRFDLSAAFSTNRTWQQLEGRITFRPGTAEFHAAASDQTLRVKVDDGAEQWDRAFTFAELTDPQTLLQEFADPVTVALLSAGAFPSDSKNLRSLAEGLKCEARNDWVRVGQTPVRAYRLQVRLMDRFQIVVFVSRAGEILRVELPDDLLLVNDQLTGF